MASCPDPPRNTTFPTYFRTSSAICSSSSRESTKQFRTARLNSIAFCCLRHPVQAVIILLITLQVVCRTPFDPSADLLKFSHGMNPLYHSSSEFIGNSAAFSGYRYSPQCGRYPYVAVRRPGIIIPGSLNIHRHIIDQVLL